MQKTKKRSEEGLFEKVYEIVRKIPKGKVMTYGQIAQMLGTRDPRKILPGQLGVERRCK